MRTFGAVSFSGTTKRGPFYKLIWSGEKRQTIREPMRNERPHVKPEHSFKLYWKIRSLLKEKLEAGEPHLIGVTRCSAYEDLTLADMWYDEENAYADGFQDLEEFRDWFDPISQISATPAWRRFKELEEDFLRQFVYKRIKWDYPLLETTEEAAYLAVRVQDMPIPFVRCQKKNCSKCGVEVWVDERMSVHWSRMPIVCLHCLSKEKVDSATIRVPPELRRSLSEFLTHQEELKKR